ncbi:MAG: hypothetical protein KAJ51_08875, partial [Thermoplasmata archaeon]|nr:hypothetical protein [Thermoplasmata archaeon]
IDDDINFKNVDYDSGEQISSEQSWEFPTGTNYTMVPNGCWYWKVRTMDSDDDWSDFNKPWKLIIDTQTPFSAPTMPINDGCYNCMDKITGIANDGFNGSGISKVEVVIRRLSDNFHWNGTSWISLKTWLLADGTGHWRYDSSEIPWLTGTRYCVQSRARDNTRNIEHPESGNIFTIDLDPPVSTIDNPKNDIWVNRLTTISGESIDLGGAGTDKVEISIKCVRDKVSGDGDAKESYFWDGTIWTQDEVWLIATGTIQWFYNISTIPWTTGDHYLIHSRATDKSTNIELPGPGKKFMYDAQPPEGLSIYINNGEEFTSSGKLKLSLQAEDVDSGISQMSFSIDGEYWSAWESFNATTSYELTEDESANDGEKTVYYKVRDYAGNIAERASDTIILDNTPPSSLSIKINANAKFTILKLVRLTLNANDLLSG